ncbi:MAG: hypothetical protein V7668_10550 [Cereibacter changlensis]
MMRREAKLKYRLPAPAALYRGGRIGFLIVAPIWALIFLLLWG